MSKLSEHVVNFITDIANKECITNTKISVEIREFSGDNFLGEIQKVNLSGDHNGQQKSLPLIIKKSSENCETRKCMDMKGYYKTEVFFYKDILPAFEILQDKYGLLINERFHYPKFYSSSLQELKELIILGDLSYDGYIMHNRRKPLDYDHLVLAVQSLARLHAASFVMKEENPTLYSKLINGVPHKENYGDFIENIMESCLERVLLKLNVEENKKKVREFRGNARKIFRECLDSTRTHPYNVICHGDAYLNNFLFKYENSLVSDIILYDWQLGRFASPVTDLAYMICLSTDQDYRDKHLQSLLDLYYSTLSSNIAKMGQDVQKCYPKHAYEQHLKDVFRFGVLFAMMGTVYLLKKPGDERTIEEISDELKNGDLGVEYHDEVVKRLEGLLTGFIKLGYV